MKQNTDLSTLSQENLTLLLQSLVQQNTELQAFQLDELKEKRAEKEEERRIQLESKKQNSLAMERKHQQDLAAQDHCHHLKGNGQSHLVGQRDHNNNYHYFCQTCQKHWLNEIPGHLQIDMNRVGGPQL